VLAHADKKGTDSGVSSASQVRSTEAQSQQSATDQDRIADGEALESAIADFAANANPFTLGAVPSKPRQSTRLASGPTIDIDDGQSAVPDSPSSSDDISDSAEEQAAAAEMEAKDAYQTIELTTPAGEPSRVVRAKAREPTPGQNDGRDSSRASTKAGESNDKPTSPARRLMNLAGGARPAGRPEYRPRSALSLARRRMIATYLPFEWQKGIRRQAEDIPEQQFNYLLSTLAIATSAFLGGTIAYWAWPVARSTVIWLFNADSVEARVLQARHHA
jgi:hypothetical protein